MQNKMLTYCTMNGVNLTTAQVRVLSDKRMRKRVAEVHSHYCSYEEITFFFKDKRGKDFFLSLRDSGSYHFEEIDTRNYVPYDPRY